MNLERWLLALTPAVALATVALGLRLGAPNKVQAAVVYATSSPLAAGQRAFSVFVFREEAGTREAVENLPIVVSARTAQGDATCGAITNEDGVAECAVPVAAQSHVTELAVSGGGGVLASGEPIEEPPAAASPGDAPWLPFVRRDGEIAIDAVLVGERAAPRFPATIWVHARERETGHPIAHASIEFEGDASLTPRVATGTTDARGWAAITTTPLGLAVEVTIRARARREGGDGAEILGEWVAPFPMAPGAAQVETRSRWAPGEEIEIDLTEPDAWRTAYIEVDDVRGCAWAATASGGVPRSDGGFIKGLHVPALAPGLYWAVVSAAPFGGAEGETRTAYRAFFVATTDGAALALGSRLQGPIVSKLPVSPCAAPADPRDAARALGPCLALSPHRAIDRWIALDGFAAFRQRDGMTRAKGLRIALGGLLVAALLEAALLLRGAARARVRVREEGADSTARAGEAASRGWTVVVTVLVALLGFGLLAAFLFRVS